MDRYEQKPLKSTKPRNRWSIKSFCSFQPYPSVLRLQTCQRSHASPLAGTRAKQAVMVVDSLNRTWESRTFGSSSPGGRTLVDFGARWFALSRARLWGLTPRRRLLLVPCATSTPPRTNEPRRPGSACPRAEGDLRSILVRLHARSARQCAQRTFRWGSRRPKARIFPSRTANWWDRKQCRPQAFSRAAGTIGKYCRGCK